MSEALAELKPTEISPQSLDELLDLIRAYFPNADLSLVQRAYEYSEKAHAGQIRRSGDPYILHPLGVAAILAELHLDLPSIITGLLHDTVEDTAVTLADIEKNFGATVARLVDGVTKISLMKFRNTHEKQGENIRKMIVAMGKDIRVVLVKLADRLHNMRTLNHMPPEKQARIASETLDIYAPLASRLGINAIKVELEDLSFRYVYPEVYYSLAQRVAKKKREREKYIEDVIKILHLELEKRTRIKFEVNGRPKHLWSIYRKMHTRSIDYEQVFDVLAFRVNVGSLAECYEVLGMVHSLWKPIPGRFKDFIAMPKNNNYQSLHTTVIGPGAERIEIQIRTFEMHLIAEKGIAAHWQYKESADGGDMDMESLKRFNGLREMIREHQQTTNPDEFLENFKTDLFDSEIYVFTPKGDVKEFPEGATPIDFAFSVHTDVGNRIVSARVNGKMVSLKHRLKSGDTIEVITSKTQQPSKDWLKSCVTPRAKSKIRQFVKTEERKRAHDLGKEMLDKFFRKAGMSLQRALEKPEFDKFAKDQGCNNAEDIFVKVGYGTLTPPSVMSGLQIEAPSAKEPPAEDGYIKKAFQAAIGKRKTTASLIRVDGMNDVLVRFAKCCNPIPGDSILGFITLGRGIVIHRADCVKTFELDQDRRMDVEWSGSQAPESGRTVTVRVLSHDTTGLLKGMSEVFGLHGVNILNAQARTTKDLKAICTFDVTVRNTQQLAEVISDLSKLKGVIGVTRITHS